VVNRPKFRATFDPYPFNSGYSCAVKVKGVDAEKLRVHLLDQVGLIATSPTDIESRSPARTRPDRAALRDAAHRDHELR